ncbi:MAG: NAD(P)H-hydrate dehydratase [Gemmatimonadota bacterium]|nr:NAD(P)H-hydrate dehydratase [Gemmatimonadota bacterium]
MQHILTTAQMQEVDRKTIQDLGLPGAVLMESAGRAVVKAIKDCVYTRGGKRPVILCGRGNNGGDGFVVARILGGKGSGDCCPLVFLCGRLDDLAGDAATMARVAVNCGIRVIELDEDKLPGLAEALGKADLVVDSLLGSGAKGAPRGLVARVIGMLGEYQAPVAAVDSPSGVEMDTGRVPGAAVDAHLTVTFGYENIGHRLYPGRALCGEIVVADIGFPPTALDGAGCRLFVSESEDVRRRLPVRAPDSHKGDYGKVLVLGGSTGLTGAPVMTCMTALTCGAGLVTAGVPASLNPVFETKMTEAMTLPLPDRGTGSIQPEALEMIREFLDRGVDVLALGPGLGRSEGTVRLVLELAPEIKVPTVIDADGLNAFAADPAALSRIQAPVVITPHPGEMARLCKEHSDTRKVREAPIETAVEFASKYEVTVLLKGAPTIVAESGGEGRVVLNPTGSPALAKAGSGDVLTGVITALMAQGLEVFDAAFCGAYLHGLAGDIASEKVGEHSVMATGVAEELPSAIMEVAG